MGAERGREGMEQEERAKTRIRKKESDKKGEKRGLILRQRPTRGMWNYRMWAD